MNSCWRICYFFFCNFAYLTMTCTRFICFCLVSLHNNVEKTLEIIHSTIFFNTFYLGKHKSAILYQSRERTIEQQTIHLEHRRY